MNKIIEIQQKEIDEYKILKVKNWSYTMKNLKKLVKFIMWINSMRLYAK